MATDEKWYFTKEQLANTPSRKCGIDGDKELSYRQQAANFIQDMGQRLMVSQLCINTAIVYMHRFYVFHSLTHFSRNSMASAALFLAAKVEEQPRKLEHVIKMAYMCLHKDLPHQQQTLDPKSEQYHELAQDLVCNENILLQTLGFDVAIDHPHTHVVRCCHLVKASKDLAQTSYFMASNSLHLTTMCLQYKPTIVACFCIHLACKWSNWEIPQSNEGKDWFWYVDKSVTAELLAQLTGEFLHIFDKCPSRLKRKIRSISANQSPSIAPSPSIKSPFDVEPRKVQSPATNPDGSLMFQSSRSELDGTKKSGTSQSRTVVNYQEYRQKKDHERQEREKAAAASATSGSLNTDPNKHHPHHHKQSSGITIPGKHSSSSSAIKQAPHHNHHHSSRQDVKSSSQIVQRHSSGSSSTSARELLREKQRMQREYSNLSSSGYSSHNHSLESLLESGMTQDMPTAHPPEKLNNTIHKPHSNDVRHAKQHPKETKLYAKFADPAAVKTSRKDPIEHRTEEVRKLIEKPLPPPPKPRPEIIQEEYQAMMLKSSHHPSKYHQPLKPTPTVSTSQSSLPSLGSDSKMLNVGQTAFPSEKSPNAPVSAAQISQKSSSSSKNSQAKNGNTVSATASFSLVNNSFDEIKVEKKPKEESPILPNKHRSLFSPEKIVTPDSKESHSQRLKPKQRTSPVVPKHENHLSSVNAQMDPMKQRSANNSNSVTPQKQQRLNADSNIGLDRDSKQQQENHSRRLTSSSFNPSDSAKFTNNRVPDMLQPIKDKNLAAYSDVKQSENTNMMSANQYSKLPQSQQNQALNNGLYASLAKPQDFSMMDPSSFIPKQEPPEELLSNEMTSDFMFPKQEQKVNYLPFQDLTIKQEQHGIKQELNVKQEPSTRQNSFSPLKTAQSISALLQENMGSMSPILQVPSYEQQQAQSVEEEKEPQLPSTVDMSALAAPMHCAIDIPVMTTSASVPVLTTSVVTSEPVVEEKKSEHHSKSEKKKKEKKHKHKEKDKSKDKHKHKHKDKVKEKHRRDKSEREKDKTDDGNSASGNSAALGAVPIKITIPKDRLNLSADSIGTSASSTPSSGLKIKIPKERLKGSDIAVQQQHSQAQQQSSIPQPQAPLKIKIRTDALARNTSGELQQVPGKLQQQQSNGASRKRDRSEMMEGSPLQGAPPSKKSVTMYNQQQLQQQQQQPLPPQPQRPNERQNGRHGSYNQSGNNKPKRLYDVDVSSGNAVEGHPKNFVPTSYGSFPNDYYRGEYPKLKKKKTL